LKPFGQILKIKNRMQFFCLGDLVGYNIWPNEVISFLRNRHIPTIAGNYDFGIGRTSDDCGCAYVTDIDKEMGKISISYTNEIVKEEERNYLRTLPAHFNIEVQLNNDKQNILLVHGSPRRINEYLFEDREDKSMIRIMEQANADVLCFGHTHKPYHRIFNTGDVQKPHSRYAINIGSVGKPKDNDPRSCYVILHMDSKTSVANNESIKVEFRRVEYDVEKAAKAVENSPLPNEYGEML